MTDAERKRKKMLDAVANEYKRNEENGVLLWPKSWKWGICNESGCLHVWLEAPTHDANVIQALPGSLHLSWTAHPSRVEESARFMFPCPYYDPSPFFYFLSMNKNKGKLEALAEQERHHNMPIVQEIKASAEPPEPQEAL
jgi:hypothetical protein